MKVCPFCGEDSKEKTIPGTSDSTILIEEVVITCGNKDCEMSSYLFSFDTWEKRKGGF